MIKVFSIHEALKAGRTMEGTSVRELPPASHSREISPGNIQPEVFCSVSASPDYNTTTQILSNAPWHFCPNMLPTATWFYLGQGNTTLKTVLTPIGPTGPPLCIITLLPTETCTFYDH